MSTISIKTAVNEVDIKSIEELAKDIWTQHYTPIIGKTQVDYMLKRFQSKNAIENDISKIGYTYFLAYVDGSPCCYSAVKIDNGVFLSKFYVLQKARGKGVGKAILSAINEYSKKHEQNRIWLTCNKYNPTLETYKKLGYAIIDDVVSDIGNGFVMDDYVLEKKLNAREKIIQNLKKTGLKITADIITEGGLFLHPSISSITVNGSRGPRNSFRPDSDLDIGLVLRREKSPTKELCSQIIKQTLENWDSEIELDLAVLFDKSNCGLECQKTNDYDSLNCSKGVDCIGIYKEQKGFNGFLPDIGLIVKNTLPALYIDID